MDSPKHRKKRRKGSNKDVGRRGDNSGSGQSSHHNLQQKQQHQHHQSQIDKQKIHDEKLALSQQLRQLSSQKRLKECIELYKSPTNDSLRDAHHGSIVVDCCARCGDINEAEQIVHEMLTSHTSSMKKSSVVKETRPYFWQDYKQFTYKQVPIQAWTALLKGYVHSGMLSKADSLYNYLCTMHKSIVNEDGISGGSKKRKRDADLHGVNVRTLNTLLRGCLWTATSLNNMDAEKDNNNPGNNELVGGVMTASRAMQLCGDVNIECDSSSYEYFISILSQSLQCKAAEECLQKMREQFGINSEKEGSKNGVDSSLLESLVVCLVVISRGYVLQGQVSDGKRCAEEALHCLDFTVGRASTIDSSTSNAKKQQHQTTGGKKAWARDNGNGTSRREESNKLFRGHRLSELRLEVSSLLQLCSQEESLATQDPSYVAQLMLTRCLYFSGGGTTGKDATQIITDTLPSIKNVEEVTQQWIHSLWQSFGLKPTVQRLIDSKNKEGNALKNILCPTSSSSKKKSKKNKQLPNVLTKEMCNSLQTQMIGTSSVISTDSGHVDFAQVFKPLKKDIDGASTSNSNQQDKKLHIELGSGSGDWAVLQATLNPQDNYVTVELRSDRVAQTFAKAVLHQQQTEKHRPLTNLCCVGSECGSFLRDRVEKRSVNTIFVNHPEPPTQTYNAVTDEEPAHMLNSQTIIAAARCLEPNGKGRLIIVTDNLIYARLICQTIIQVLESNKDLVGLSPEVRDLRKIESFGSHSANLHLFEGKPSSSIGHFTPRSEGGTSYFDRLWRTGAGKHADMRKRFIIGLRTAGQGDKSSRATTPGKSKSASIMSSQQGKKSNKKKSAEKQRRRNERRLLKKQQQESESSH